MTTRPAAHIRPLEAWDWGAVEEIYAQGIATGLATFETTTPTWEAFTASRLPAHRLVADVDGEVLGWAAVSTVSARPVYAGVVEHSIYIHHAARGQGLGKTLLTALIASTEAAGIWTIQSSIFPQNQASLRLHENAGFRLVGRRERIAQRADGTWQDTLFIERRVP
ncbi:GNAT family N-acetyltransferase [Arthrobacter woluwensis]|uniref:GNAT family N-acetyltransferase n=1 Tax=Arthrobacter woluwensis TaxID=156980 RepID=UPI001FD614D8|nr:GNAT family N-acetyltransferase [Arthrobacter woluwensis]